MYVGDSVLMEDTERKLKTMLYKIVGESMKKGLTINYDYRMPGWQPKLWATYWEHQTYTAAEIWLSR